MVYVGAFAASTPKIKDINYVVTTDGISYFEKIRKGVNDRLIAKSENGEKTVYKMEDVLTYRDKGREFHQKYLVVSGTQRVERIFMERVHTYKGISLFKVERTGSAHIRINDYYVYKNNVLAFQLNEENYKELLSSFFPNVNFLAIN